MWQVIKTFEKVRGKGKTIETVKKMSGCQGFGWKVVERDEEAKHRIFRALKI